MQCTIFCYFDPNSESDPILCVLSLFNLRWILVTKIFGQSPCYTTTETDFTHFFKLEFKCPQFSIFNCVQVPHIIGSCNSSVYGRTGTLYSGTFSIPSTFHPVDWNGDPEHCSSEVLRLSGKQAEGWMMNEERTKCYAITPEIDTGEMIHDIVDTSQDPPIQYCTFGLI